MARIKGIDVSYCQKGFDYAAAVKAGVKFAIIRAGFAEKEDSQLRYHIAECEKHGIDYGFYWYSYAMSVEEVIKEAEFCAKTLKGIRPKYPVFFDMEEDKQAKNFSPATITDMAVAFQSVLNRNGLPFGIYANPSWLNNYYDYHRIKLAEIWLAHWTNSPDKPSQYNFGQSMWQWGIDKIGGMEVDGNICFANYPAYTTEFYDDYDKHKPADVPQEEPQDEPIDEHEVTPDLRKGDEVTLSKAPLYVSSTAAKKSNTVTGTYYIHSDGIINSRIRITTPKGNTDCTGWVNVADCKEKKHTEQEQPALKSIDEVAAEVIRGEWGNGTERKERLTAAGYDYSAVQKRVNEIL